MSLIEWDRVGGRLDSNRAAGAEVFTLLIRHRCYLITRLRHDAARYHLWTKGRQPGQRGPTRRYESKAVFNDLTHWQHEGTHLIHAHIELYGALLYSKHFERKLRVVLLLDSRHQKYVLLASTDEQQSASQIAYYYHLRFSRVAGAIELLFRDAKQFTGLSQCQARSDTKLDYHINATLSGINVARHASLLNSMNALVRRETNRRIWKTIYSQLSINGSGDINRLDILNCQFWQRRAA